MVWVSAVTRESHRQRGTHELAKPAVDAVRNPLWEFRRSGAALVSLVLFPSASLSFTFSKARVGQLSTVNRQCSNVTGLFVGDARTALPSARLCVAYVRQEVATGMQRGWARLGGKLR